MEDRDMFYSSYGYNSMPYNPMMSIPFGMNPIVPNYQIMPYNMNQSSTCNNSNSNNNDEINNRLDRMERQIRRMDARITRLENPYSNNNTTNIYNEPDSNMYMM